MNRSIIFLILWFMAALVLSGLFVLPTPPGGVTWPYHFVVASIPFAAFWCARYVARVSIIVSFGLIAGFVFAWPYFTHGRSHLRIEHGLITAQSVAFKISAFTLLMALVFAGAFAAGRRLLSRDEIRAAANGGGP